MAAKYVDDDEWCVEQVDITDEELELLVTNVLPLVEASIAGHPVDPITEELLQALSESQRRMVEEFAKQVEIDVSYELGLGPPSRDPVQAQANRLAAGQFLHLIWKTDKAINMSRDMRRDTLPIEGSASSSGQQSSRQHQWQTTKTVVHEVNVVETRRDSSSSSRGHREGRGGGCCNEGLEGRLGASNKAVARDLPGTEHYCRSVGDGENSECSQHSHACSDSHEECRHMDNPPCDCCRHGHSLTSFIRNPDDCRTCLRHMGGGFISPKFTQIKQRMLKTLNQRRDHSEENPDAAAPKSDAPAQVKSIPCGRKERLIILNHENENEDVDYLVRKIEGTSINNDPKKAAKKARQKEKKMQVKQEEERQREEEERRIREEQERLQREQEERENEELRKAEEQKRQARRQKKKNKKKRDAEKSAPGGSNDDSPVAVNADNGSGTNGQISLAVTNGNSSSPSEAVRKVLETVKPTPDVGDKPRMVTIRRHLTTQDNQNVVTITLSDDNQGKGPVYMLVNGQLVATESMGQQNKAMAEHSTEDKSEKKPNKKKNTNKKKGTGGVTNEEFGTASTHSKDNITVLPLNELSRQVHLNDNHTSNSSHNCPAQQTHVDLEKLNLPPGITITKVPSVKAAEQMKEVRTGLKHQSYSQSNEHLYYVGDDDEDFFGGRKENEEFEEVVSNKTRRKRIKAATAAKTTNRDPSEEGDIRESPNSLKQMSRKQFICDAIKPSVEKPGEHFSNQFSKRTVNGNAKAPKPVAKKQMGGEFQNHSKIKTDYRHDGSTYFSSSGMNSVPVMPRLSRNPLRNGNSPNHQGYQNYDTPTYTIKQNSTPTTFQISPKISPPTPSAEDSRFCEGNLSRNRFENSSHLVSHSTTQSQNNPLLNPQTNPSIWSQLPQSQLQNQQQQHTITQNQNLPLAPLVQPDRKEESWSPWKDWSEHSTPEHPSPRFGLEQSYKDPLPKIYAFQDLMRKSSQTSSDLPRKSPSPIQRPIHSHGDLASSQNNIFENNHSHYPSSLRNAQITLAQGSQSSFKQMQSFGETGTSRFPMHQRTVPESNLGYYSNMPATDVHARSTIPPTESAQQQDHEGWNSFSGVPPAFLQRRPSDKSDFVLTQKTMVQDPNLWSNEYSGPAEQHQYNHRYVAETSGERKSPNSYTSNQHLNMHNYGMLQGRRNEQMTPHLPQSFGPFNAHYSSLDWQHQPTGLQNFPAAPFDMNASEQLRYPYNYPQKYSGNGNIN